jgi:hypothetical protein
MLRALQRAIWLALFGCLVFGFAVAVWSASQQAVPHDYRQPAKSEKQSWYPGIFNPTNKQNDTEGQYKSEWYDKPTDWLLVLFNALLAIFTWRLWISTARLFKVTK